MVAITKYLGIRSAKTVGIFPQSAEIANTVKTESGSEATQREAKGQQDQERGPLVHFYHNQLKLQSDERVGAVGLKIYLCLVLNSDSASCPECCLRCSRVVHDRSGCNVALFVYELRGKTANTCT